MHYPILQTVITCPHCNFAKQETMPQNTCQYLYTCTHCGSQLKPQPGKCCIFCSYGSLPCPPQQLTTNNYKQNF